jgi:hypothetical protein
MLVALQACVFLGFTGGYAAFTRIQNEARAAVYREMPPKVPAVVLIPSQDEVRLTRLQLEPLRLDARDLARNGTDFTGAVLYGRDLPEFYKAACALRGGSVFLWRGRHPMGRLPCDPGQGGSAEPQPSAPGQPSPNPQSGPERRFAPPAQIASLGSAVEDRITRTFNRVFFTFRPPQGGPGRYVAVLRPYTGMHPVIRVTREGLGEAAATCERLDPAAARCPFHALPDTTYFIAVHDATEPSLQPVAGGHITLTIEPQ